MMNELLAQKLLSDVQEIQALGPNSAFIFWIFFGILVLGPLFLVLLFNGGSRTLRPNGYLPRRGVSHLQIGPRPQYTHGQKMLRQNLTDFLEGKSAGETIYWHHPRQTWVTDPAELNQP